MIKDKKTRDKLLKSFPKVSDKELTELSKKYMPQYVVYKQTKRGVYECYCTRCEKHYINDTVSGREYVPIVGHGEKGVCLACGSDVKFLARGRGRNSILNKENFAIFKLKGRNVYIQVYRIYARFTEHGRSDFGFGTDDIYKCTNDDYFRYALTPKGAQKWEHWWHFNYRSDNYIDSWEEKQSEGNPCFANIWGSDSSYIAVGTECISKSFIHFAWEAAQASRYSRDLEGSGIIRFCCEYCNHPNIEYLIKTGFGYVADAKLGGYMHDIRVNWRSNDVKKMLKLNKVEMDELANKNMDTLSAYYRLRKLDPSMEPEERVGYAHKMYDIDTLELIIRETGLSLRKALNYRDKQKMGLRDWKDYIDQCKKLEYDLSDESITRPKDFFYAHERLSRIIEAMVNAEKNRQLEETNRQREEMQYVDEELGLMIVLPQSVSDIVREGKIQNHCVGGYADRHAEGKLHILFLRKIEEPDKPYYTMEVNTKGTIVQCRGYANNWESRGGKPKTEDVIEFEKRYQKYLNKLFKKKSKQKTKAA